MQFVYVSLKGKQEPCRIAADKVEESDGASEKRLVIKKGTATVGSFDATFVEGWWTQNEDKTV